MPSSPRLPLARPPLSRRPLRHAAGALALGAAAMLVVGVAVSGASPAYAATTVGLGTARSYAVLAASQVSSTGPTVVSGDLGLTGTNYSGFPPGEVIDGTENITNVPATLAQADLTAAYLEAASAPTDADLTGQDLGGMTLLPGVYEDTSTMELTGTVTLDAQGDPDAVFIFKAGSSLVTASDASVSLIGDASPCHVFWQVTSTATLGTNTDFVGTVMALTSIVVENNADVEGAVLARNGAVTLDTNDITQPGCARVSAPPSSTPTTSPSGGGTTSPGGGGSTAGGGSSSGGDGGGGGGGDDGGDGGGGDGGGPVVPVGNPDTGAAPSSPQGGAPVFYALAGLAALAALLAVGQARRTPRTPRTH